MTINPVMFFCYQIDIISMVAFLCDIFFFIDGEEGRRKRSRLNIFSFQAIGGEDSKFIQENTMWVEEKALIPLYFPFTHTTRN